MKKLISLLLALCMACMLIPAVAEDSPVGVWYAVKVIMKGVEVNPADMGMDWTMTFNEDGSFVNSMGIMGQSQDTTGTWTYEGGTLSVTSDGSTAALPFADGAITIDMGEEGSAVFTQEAPAAAPKAAVVAAESEDVFLGSWALSSIDIMGIHATKDMFASFGMEGYEVSMVIEPGKVTMTSATAGTDPSSTEMESVFEGGKLLVKIPNLEESLQAAGELGLNLDIGDTQTIELVEDGTILYSMEFMGMSMGVYLEKTDAAAEAPAA